MPAPAVEKNALASKVNLSMDILAIQEINEVDSFLALQFDLRMAWFDPRVSFRSS